MQLSRLLTNIPVGSSSLLAGVLVALSASVPAQRLHVQNYTAGDGLESHEIEGIAQLESGAIAFLTRQGLSIYDGASWSLEAEFPLDADHPWHLASGEGNDLWIHVGDGCWRRDEEGWTRVTTAPAESKDSSFFTILEQGQGSSMPLISTGSGLLHTFDGDEWSTTAVPMNGAELTALTVARGRCLIGSAEGILEFDHESGDLAAWDLDLPSNSMTSLAYDAIADSLWIVGGANRILRVDGVHRDERLIGLNALSPFESNPPARVGPGERKSLARWTPGISHTAISGPAGGVYYGDRLGVQYYNPKTGFEHIGEDQGLNSNSISCALLDREGNIWIGSTRGASKVVSRRIRSYNRDHGLLDHEVTSTLQRSDGSIVLGQARGLTLLDSEGEGAHSIHRLSDEKVRMRIMDLAEDEAGTTWFAAGALGLGALYPDNTIEINRLETSEYAVAVVPSSDGGGLWVATDLGLYRYLDETWTPVPLPERLANVEFRNLVGADGSAVYAATRGHGVLLIGSEVMSAWSSPDGRLRSTYTVLVDSSGRGWAGTRRGLARLGDAGDLVPVEGVDLERPIYALTEDLEGHLWIGSDIGIHRWDGSTLESFALDDGLAGEEANRSAAMVTEDGRVWFGSNHGLSIYDQRFDLPPLHGPVVEFETVEAGGETYDLLEPHTIDYGARSLTFKFKVFSFIDEDRVRVKARLNGWDAEWSSLPGLPSREVTFSNLPPGDYQLEMMAEDLRGQVSPVVRSARIRIQQPIWQRPVARFLGGLLLVAILGGVVMLFLQRRYATRLRKEVEVRTQELREMEREQEKLLRVESLGLLAAGIAHDFNNLLTTITGNASLLDDSLPRKSWERSAANDIGIASKKAASLASQLLTFSQGGTPIRSASSLGDVLRDCVDFSLHGSNVTVEWDLPEDPLSVELDPDQFSQVIHNLMINARQAMSDGGKVWIRGRREEGQDGLPLVVIEFTDSGPGIAPSILEEIFTPYFTTKAAGHGLGLATASSIVEGHGGSLSAHSGIGEGATFRLELPASNTQLVEGGSIASRVEDSPTNARVLVMDDQKAVLDIASKILTRWNCEVVEAREGSEAVRLYKSAREEGTPFDVVVMDVTVPGGMGGIEAATLIWDFDRGAKIIISSGYAEGEYLSEYEKYGFSARLRKPYTGQQLREVISSVTEASAVERSG